jgi:arylsulfatase A-like enzyme
MASLRLLIASATLAASLPLLAQSQLSATPPNIVFILADDMGSADLGVYGSGAIRTPHLDRMAAEGIRFTQAYAGNTVCAPSRSTLMTGTHMGHTPVRSNTGGVSLRDSDVTIAELLKTAGYATGGFGKWGLAEIGQPGVPEKQGFDEFFGYYHQIHAHEFYPAYLYRNSERVDLPGNAGFYDGPAGDGRGIGPVPPTDAATGRSRQFSHYLIVERMKAFIRANRARPFFAYGAWTPPHSRWELPEDDPAWQIYKDAPWPIAAKAAAAFTSMVDRHAGEILALLRELGLEERTIVFFASDNGGLTAHNRAPLFSNRPLRGGKTTLYEGGLRVPLIARWRGTIAPRVTDHVTYFPDVLPTLADLARVSARVPAVVDGLSIVPELLGTAAAGRPQQSHAYLYWEDADIDWNAVRYLEDTTLRQAVRAGDWKGIRLRSGAPLELYNLREDVAESRNVAADHPDVVRRLEGVMRQAHASPPPQIEPPRVGGRSYR